MCSIELRLVLSLCLAGMKIKQVLGINANQICAKHGNKVGFKGLVSSRCQPWLGVFHMYRHSEIQSVILEVLCVVDWIVRECRVRDEFEISTSVVSISKFTVLVILQCLAVMIFI